MRVPSRIALVFAVICCVGSMFPRKGLCVEITDDLGRTVRLAQPARRIISLYGAFSEMLFSIGAGSQVIARTQADRYPESIVKLPPVGTHMRPNVEIILGLKPDLVIQSGSRFEAMGELDSLRSAGIPVVVFSPKTFEDIFVTMMRLGVLTGRESDAQAAVDRLKGRLGAVRSHRAGVRKRPRVFFEIRAEPITAAGRNSIVQDILEAVGAENVVKSNKAVVRYNLEELLVSDPDIYIIQKGPMNRNPRDLGKRIHFDKLRAVREGKMIFVDEFLFSRPGPRCVDAVEQLAVELERL